MRWHFTLTFRFYQKWAFGYTRFHSSFLWSLRYRDPFLCCAYCQNIYCSLSQPSFICDKVFRNPSKICGRQPLKNCRGSFTLSSTNFTWYFLNTLFHLKLRVLVWKWFTYIKTIYKTQQIGSGLPRANPRAQFSIFEKWKVEPTMK